MTRADTVDSKAGKFSERLTAGSPDRGVASTTVRLVPISIAIVAASMLASCALAPPKTASSEYFSEKEYGVAASPKVAAKQEAVPKGGGRYHVGKPYTVKGKTYRPKEDQNYAKVGHASWYGRAFHGRQTANGEIYDMGELTAAHPTLPLPSYVRVTNLSNDRSLVVRVNDRGPFKRGRIIDVSSAAADMLDFKHAGTAKVKVEYVGRARLDAKDRQMLLASYRGPDDLGGNTLFAAKATEKPKKTVLASFAPWTRKDGNQSDGTATLFAAQPLDNAATYQPAVASTPVVSTSNDQLGSLILQAGFVQ